MKRLMALLMVAGLMAGNVQAHDEPLNLDQLIAAFGWDFKTAQITTEKVADGLYVLFGVGGNVGLSIGPQGVLIVDDQFPEMTSKIG